ncbi:MAG: FtsX-like permease family protein, partial [Xanthobacteraceae bacterium]
HLEVGSSVAIQTPSGAKRTLVLRGVYDPPSANQLLGDVSMSKQAFDKAFNNPKNSITFLAGNAEAGKALEAAAKDSGGATFHTGAEYPQDATKEMATVMAMLYVLLGFSVIVSLFGMVNTMVLSVFERTREIGMLRTIGMTRRQARRMIRHESIITALIGTTLGLGLGLFLAGLVTKAIDMEGLAFSVPVQPLAAFTLVAVIAGIGAAIEDVRDRPAGAVPVHLRDASYPGARKLGHGEGYVYPHDAPAGWVPQQYRPADVEARVYYHPGAQGHEAELGELLERRRTRREAEGEHADDSDDRDDVGDPSEGA